jgi:glycosyltransferase involved in cell wall biosynthesis
MVPAHLPVMVRQVDKQSITLKNNCMKILMVVDSIVKGGKERRMLELVKALTRQGQDYEIYLVSLTNVVEYDYVHQLPIKLEIIERKSKKDFRVVFKLRKIIKTFQPDIIHSWGTMASIYLSMVNLFTKKSRFINGTIADAYQNLNWFDTHYLRTKLTTPFSKVLLGNSQAGIKAYRVPLHKTVCIYNGIDLKRFQNLTPPEQMEYQLLGRKREDSYIAAMVGAFENRKDYDTLIKAAVQLCAKNKKVVFILIGEGSLMDSIKQQVPVELNSQILFLGSRSDIEAILQIIDVGLLITPCEGISNSIMEYMASGKPVIASREGGTKELVIDGETGFLVDQKRSDQIIEKIELLMKNPKLAKALGQNGQQRIREHFDLAKMTDSFKALYNKLSKPKTRLSDDLPVKLTYSVLPKKQKQA